MVHKICDRARVFPCYLRGPQERNRCRSHGAEFGMVSLLVWMNNRGQPLSIAVLVFALLSNTEAPKGGDGRWNAPSDDRTGSEGRQGKRDSWWAIVTSAIHSARAASMKAIERSQRQRCPHRGRTIGRISSQATQATLTRGRHRHVLCR